MRLWHYKLIPALPKKQLIAQWRELCAIASNLNDKGTPNHLLVNRILDYPISNFYTYAVMIINEFNKRHYKISSRSLVNFTKNQPKFNLYSYDPRIRGFEVFKGWHNVRYLRQCYYNLQEKYDCGGISKEEWNKLFNCFVNS